MRRLFIRPEQLASAAGARVPLDDAQRRHLAVLRLADGAELEVFDGLGARHLARLTGESIELTQKLPDRPRGALEAWLAQALSKADKLELVLQKATELGAARVLPFEAERSVVKLEPERAQHKLERWTRIAQEAARQCGRAEVPAIDAPVTFAKLLDHALSDPERRVILLDTGALPLTLSQAARGEMKVVLVVGPEGGFSNEERALAESKGALLASMGQLILRTETAGLVALSIVRHLAGELG
ncbi:MAG: 16S rRNA (uracil(1498)-N(3))-methyltransferase [Deltaproteobacteria bacterium]|nr:16S rRNA (uracil(1498)-N(3))-methyltransferase [Deltaproteobacteria bacterium]